MKYGFISDTHGGIVEVESALEALKDCNIIFHLGDVLYHGPRNSLPSSYEPKELFELLKNINNIVYIRGNCDADVDETVLNKDLKNKRRIEFLNNIKTLMTHGYEEDDNERISYAKKENIKMIVTGHTHKKVLTVHDGIIILNPGSSTLPKDGIKSYAKMDEHSIRLCEIGSNKVLKTLNLNEVL